MKLIVGLGNPGRFYSASRHNIGSLAARALAKKHKIALRRDNSVFSLCGRGRILAEDVLLAVPLTFMNLSGRALSALIKKYKLHLKDILVICDDLDLDPAQLKVKSCGSSGGHKGLKSIIDRLGSRDFNRLRIGIGRPDGNADVADYVLSAFNKAEKENLERSIKNAVACCELWISEGITKSMNTFNRRSSK